METTNVIETSLRKLGTKELQKKIEGKKLEEVQLQIAMKILTERANKASKKEVNSSDESAGAIAGTSVPVIEEKKKEKPVVDKIPTSVIKKHAEKQKEEKSKIAEKKAESKKEKKPATKKPAEKKPSNIKCNFDVDDKVSFKPSGNNKKLVGHKIVNGTVLRVFTNPALPGKIWLRIKINKTDQKVHKLASACEKA